MAGKLDEILNNAKINELLNKKKAEDENKTCLLWILAIIGVVATMAAVAYAVYRFRNLITTNLRMILKTTISTIKTSM